MYTAVSACLKQLAQSYSTTFNHAFVYVIKIKKEKKERRSTKDRVILSSAAD